jgi:anti-anti-sigma regulatory factor
MDSKETIITTAVDNGVLQLIFEGDLSIHNSTAVKEAFLKHSSAGKTEVRLANVSAIDLTFLQLLYSFKKQRGGSVHVRCDLQGTHHELIQRAGLSALLK